MSPPHAHEYYKFRVKIMSNAPFPGDSQDERMSLSELACLSSQLSCRLSDCQKSINSAGSDVAHIRIGILSAAQTGEKTEEA